jgi:hypothetical protein
VAAQDVLLRFEQAGLGVGNVQTPTRMPNDPLPDTYREWLQFEIEEIAPNGGQVFVCDTRQACDAVYDYFAAFPVLSGHYYRSRDGRIVMQLSGTLAPASATRFEAILNEF